MPYQNDAAIVTRLVNQRKSDAEIQALFRQNPRGEYAEKSPNQRDAWLQRLIVRQRRFARSDSPTVQRLKRLESLVKRSPTGRESERALLLAHLHTATISGHNSYQVSRLTLSEYADLSHTSITPLNNVLKEKGFLYIDHSGFKQANRYTIRPDRIEAAFTKPTQYPYSLVLGRSCKLVIEKHDCFARKGLGKRSGHIWRVLCESDEPLTSKQIALMVGCSKQTANGKLAKMVKHNMVTVEDSLYSPVRDVDLDAMARDLKVDGMAARRVEYHKRKREAWEQKRLGQWLEKQQQRAAKRRETAEPEQPEQPPVVEQVTEQPPNVEQPPAVESVPVEIIPPKKRYILPLIQSHDDAPVSRLNPNYWRQHQPTLRDFDNLPICD